MGEQANHTIGDATHITGALMRLGNGGICPEKENVGVYEAVVECTLLYHCEMGGRGVIVQEIRRAVAIEINCLHNICGDGRIHRVQSE